MELLRTAMAGRPLRTAHAQIVDTLGRDIIAGRIASGTILPGDAELMERFGVSRTVLREALKSLAAKGLIVPRARIGTRVTERSGWSLFDPDILAWHFDTGIDDEFLQHISEVRLAFEPFAAGLAAERATPAEIATLKALATQMGDPGLSAENHALTDLSFHLAVAESCRNPFMRSVGSMIEAALVGVFRLSSPTEDKATLAAIEASHRRIADAIGDRDPLAARAAMEAVILTGVERVRRALRSGQRRPLKGSQPQSAPAAGRPG
jgi:DNA-binding FadR family transcriptional regulator